MGVPGTKRNLPRWQVGVQQWGWGPGATRIMGSWSNTLPQPGVFRSQDRRVGGPQPQQRLSPVLSPTCSRHRLGAQPCSPGGAIGPLVTPSTPGALHHPVGDSQVAPSLRHIPVTENSKERLPPPQPNLPWRGLLDWGSCQGRCRRRAPKCKGQVSAGSPGCHCLP